MPTPMPQEFWEDIELEIDFAVEEKHRKEWLQWKQMNSF